MVDSVDNERFRGTPIPIGHDPTPGVITRTPSVPVRCLALLKREHETQAVFDLAQLGDRQTTGPFGQKPLVQRHDLRHVNDRLAVQANATLG